MLRRTLVVLVIAVVVGVFAGPFSCSSDDTGANDVGGGADNGGGKPQGSEGGRCFPNRTCNQGLTCLSNYCVVYDGGSPTDTGGADTFIPPQDTGVPDTGPADTSIPQDVGQADTGPTDAADDTGAPDTGVDGGFHDTGCDDACPQWYPRHGHGCKLFHWDQNAPDIDDPLKGSTKGRVVGAGTVTSEGFMLPAAVDCNDATKMSYVNYQIPTSECGIVEFDMKGIDGTFSCPPSGEEIFGMYDGSWQHPNGQFDRDVYKDNPYRTTLSLSCDDPSGACTPKWGAGLFYVGNDTLNGATNCLAFESLPSLTLDPAQTYHVKITWLGDDNYADMLVDINGKAGYNKVARGLCGDYIAWVHNITIGGTPNGMMPASAVFSNVKIWWWHP